MKRIVALLLISLVHFPVLSQETFPVNGVTDKRHLTYAFINATIHLNSEQTLSNATMLVKDGVIEQVGAGIVVPAHAIVKDLKGRNIYPAFVDPYTEYGIPSNVAPTENARGPQIETKTKGAYSWNQALKPEYDAGRNFVADNTKATEYRKAGFGTVLSLRRDGITRGTAALVSLGDAKENELLLINRAAACYSFDKGTSAQEYPNSEMGSIALLRQSFLDAQWYAAGGSTKEANISTEAWIKNQSLPQIFECNDKWEVLRADKIGTEFNVDYIIKGSGDEYKRADLIKATGNRLILPLKFPEAYDVSDPYEALNISLEELKHWETAPANAAILNQKGVTFAFTAYGLKEPSQFLGALRKVVSYGLPVNVALKACTETPAAFTGIGNRTGMIKAGYIANFLITTGDLFEGETILLENWIQGKPYVLQQVPDKDIRGNYMLSAGSFNTTLQIGGELYDLKATIKEDTSTVKASVTYNNDIINIAFELKKEPAKGSWSLTGYPSGKGFKGSGLNAASSSVNWFATFSSPYVTEAKKDTAKKEVPTSGTVWYPDKAYGFASQPGAVTTLIKNVTVWTNEKEGIIENGDVLLKDGKIARVGKNLSADGAVVIDGTGKHLTAGIIDEHSHIAISNNVNECSHAVTSEVRIGDMIDPDDINIYRQLSGGVTAAQLLHGSCNPIGGQSAIVKFRWGLSPEQFKMEGAPQFIKFALGENVKQSNWGDDFRIRYPQTRMGVEQVYLDAFSRAKEYESEWKKYRAQPKGDVAPRRDLRLEALNEILKGTRFITCHSYQQGEINMLMKVADSMGFKVNTFTHILEGYKVADKMKKHGVGASSFSDWWAYKYEVMEAIPYNGAILHNSGITVAYNSDDAEMARRLNQEAAKAVKYGNVSEEEALKFVTLNPARLLHIDNRVGSIKEGKDADVVLWSQHPLSVYASVDKTFIDGICYYDKVRDEEMRKTIATERARLLRKMNIEKNKAGSSSGSKPTFRINKLHHCTDDAAH